jgi:perosamine synthetase
MKNKRDIMNAFIPVNQPLLDGNEKKYLNECIETGWISSEGPFVGEFENKFSNYVDRKFGVAVANGSAALDIAVAALDIGVGDEVILPTHTIISCAASVVRAGAVPKVVDSDPITWNMDVKQVEVKITKKTKAIMVVHIFGLPVDMDPVLKLANKHNLKIIEDAAQMIGQEYRGRPCGSFGDLSTFSFYPNKHITTGEGGMIVTNSPDLAARCRSFRNLCFQPKKRFVHEKLGWNYRMTNLQAALGLAQLEKIDRHIEIKRNTGIKYNEMLRDIRELERPPSDQEYARNIFWVYGLILSDSVAFDAETAMKRMASMNIGTRPFFWPMHEQPVFRKMGLFDNKSYPMAERMARRGLYIPSGMALTEKQIECVSDVLHEIFS